MEGKEKLILTVPSNDFCIVCLTQCPNSLGIGSGRVVGLDFKLISEFLKLDLAKIFGGKAPLEGGEEESHVEVLLCETCEASCKTFADMYTEWRRLTRGMKESLQRMHGAMVDAGRDWKKVKGYLQGIQERDGDGNRSPLEVVKASIPELFRKEMIAKCALKMTMKMPEKTSEGDAVDVDVEMREEDEVVSTAEAEWKQMEELGAGKSDGYLQSEEKEDEVVEAERGLMEEVGAGDFDSSGQLGSEEHVMRYHCMVDGDEDMEGMLASGDKTTKYICEICGKVSGSRKYFQLHQRWHEGEKPFECGHCGKMFRDSGNLRTHVIRHHKEIFYMRYKDSGISTPAFRAGLDQLIQSAISERAPDDAEKAQKVSYYCTFCKEGFSQLTAVESHVVLKHYDLIAKGITNLQLKISTISKKECLVHMNELMADGNGVRECGGCSAKFIGAEALKLHVRSHFSVHPEQKRINDTDHGSNILVGKSLIQVKVKCARCDQYFKDVQALNNHKEMMKAKGGCRSTSRSSLNASQQMGDGEGASRASGSGRDAFVQCVYCRKFIKSKWYRRHRIFMHRSEVVGEFLQLEVQPAEIDKLIDRILRRGNEESVSECIIKCFLCNKRIGDYKKLSQHVMACHLEELVKAVNEKLTEEVMDSDEDVDPDIPKIISVVGSEEGVKVDGLSAVGMSSGTAVYCNVEEAGGDDNNIKIEYEYVDE